MKTCARQTLAAGGLAMVEQCSCGAVHVTIGAITLRLAADAIASIATTLNDAARELMLGRAFTTATARNEALS